MRILVIDDEEEIRKMVSLALSKKGYDVVTAGNISDAAKLIRNNTWELVITDIMIPYEGGFELVEAIKSLQHATPVIIMSGMNQDVLFATNTKADAILPKPFNDADLIYNVQQLIGKKEKKGIKQASKI